MARGEWAVEEGEVGGMEGGGRAGVLCQHLSGSLLETGAGELQVTWPLSGPIRVQLCSGSLGDCAAMHIV